MTSIKFTIPGDPVPQSRPRFTKTGHAFTPTKTRNAQALVKMLAGQTMGDRTPLSGPVELVCRVFLRIPISKPAHWKRDALCGSVRPDKRPDLTNVVKQLEDGMNGVVYLDDRQIVTIHVEKWYSEQPCCHVEVKEWKS